MYYDTHVYVYILKDQCLFLIKKVYSKHGKKGSARLLENGYNK